MTSHTLRAGVLGCGDIARRGHIPGYRAAGVEVAAVCDANIDRARAVAADLNVPDVYADYHELIARPDIDLISVCLPNALHAEASIAALQAGKHVLCEKPIATSSADAERMIETARQAGTLLSVNQHMRFDPTAQAMRQAVCNGELGDLYLIDMRMVRSQGIPGYGSWFTNKELAGAGALFDIGVHMLDLAMYLAGFPQVAAVRGFTSMALGKQKIGLGSWGADRGTEGRYDVEDTAIAHITLTGGGVIRLIVTWAAFGLSEERITLFGDKGGADRSADRYGKETPLRFYKAINGKIEGFTPDLSCFPAGGTAGSIASFVSAVRGKRPLLVHPEETLTVLKMLEMIQRSAATGQEVTL
ncbi:MAG: Gfo/Idh/MocA family oxidoreductase [Anaerolineae bacterium]|nr:Gfo/Idh/MocA family oxidoreductase [Thermoflexales bacterium]MDW8407980.1 Gfo/Idh/MocA family oxidoreductase [Anaerolineae bacterium]